MSAIDSTIDLRSLSSTRGISGLWRMMSGFKLVFLGAVLSLGIAAMARTATFLFLRFFVDRVLVDHGWASRLPLFALAFIALALMEGGGSFISGKLAAGAAEGVTLRLRNFLYDHIQRLSFSYHDHSSTGELIERVTSDVDTLRRFYAEQATGIGRIIALFVFNLAAVTSLNRLLALLSVVLMPLILIQAGWFFKRISVVYEQYQEQEARLSTMLQENISAIRIVRAFARHKFEIRKFEKENWRKFQRGRQYLLLNSFYWPTSDILCTIQMLLIFFLGAGMAISGEISLGTYLAISSMVIWIIWPMRNLGRVVIQASSALVSYRRVSRIISAEREDFGIDRQVQPQPIKGQVDFSGVSFEYREGEGVLHQISFSCKPGQLIALLGKAGSGKTSLVNLLPRFYDYTGGSLKLDGRELTSYSLHALRSQIGIVEQEPFLFSRSISENIIYGAEREVSQQEIEDAARAAAIHDVIMSFPEGYNTRIGERGVTLSGGQKQRLAIARTILKNPRILILDDATSSVDSETEELIQRALSRLMEGRSSFIIAHRVQTVMRADKILVLEQGRIVQEGIHRVLIQEEGFYKQIFDLQFAEMA
ncbi:MAG: ATP-binding cassette domain-containing protein [Spirochaeta sp.]|nr:ATP-binding cassette domain-containing protein [Spirochaeta sp.]